MVSFEQFKRKPLTREELEEKSRGVRKTGEILRSLEEPSEEKIEGASPKNRDERQLEALEKEIAEVARYMAEKISGYAELKETQKQSLAMTAEERAAAVKNFDKHFPGSREEIQNSLREIKERKEAIEKIKERLHGASPFEKAA